MIMFLPIYCPNNVGISGAVLNDISGKKNSGKKVKVIWHSAIIIACFVNIFKRNNNPIETSSIANKIMEMWVGIMSKVST